MREVPIYTCKAHVFLIDPDTKKSWVPASRTAVPVNFFYDSARRSYRIISVDGTKAIINSTMMPEMVFTKTSAKFGQWADIRAGTVYGLGFNTDNLLNKFLENFNDIRDRAVELKGQADMKEIDANTTSTTTNTSSSGVGVDSSVNEVSATSAVSSSATSDKPQQHVNFRTSKDVVLNTTPTKKPPASMMPNGGGAATTSSSSGTLPPSMVGDHYHDNHHHHHPHHPHHHDVDTDTKLSGGGGGTPSHVGSTSSASGGGGGAGSSAATEVKNLRHQNERLRQAIAQSNANAKKYESEMQALKNTNSRLTAALQESMTSVDQWHRQLASYKEENEKLKRKLGEQERSHKHDSEGANEQLEHVRRQVDQLQIDNNEKTQECSLLQQRVGLLNVIERQHNEATARLKKSQEECSQLKNRLQAFEERMSAQTHERNQRQRLCAELSARLSECESIAHQIKATN